MLFDDWAPPSSDEEIQPTDEAPAACPTASSECPSAAAKSAACPSGEPRGSAPRRQQIRRHAPADKRKICKQLRIGSKFGGVPQPALKRTLQRRPTEGKPHSEEVSNMICVWGGTVKHPVPVWPLFREGDAFWLQLSEHSHWLRRACDQKGRTHYKDWRLAPNLRDICSLRIRNTLRFIVWHSGGNFATLTISKIRQHARVRTNFFETQGLVMGASAGALPVGSHLVAAGVAPGGVEAESPEPR